MASFLCELRGGFAEFAVKSFSGAGLLITVAGSVIAGEILIRCQLRRFQEVVISGRADGKALYAAGVDQHVI